MVLFYLNIPQMNQGFLVQIQSTIERIRDRPQCFSVNCKLEPLAFSGHRKTIEKFQ